MSDQAWKFLDEKNDQIVSRHGDMTWTIGTWEHQDGRIRACRCGFHCSALISQAFSYVQGSVLARVEVRGQKDSDSSDKAAAYSDMRITEAYHWTPNDSVALAVFAAELVIEIFESNRPGDDRPRKAIEAAKKYLEAPENSDAAARAAADAAAYAAYAAAYAADAAAYAAYAAAYAADAAAYAADAAARAAADAAAYAAYAAAYAAYAAAYAADAAAYAAADAAYAADAAADAAFSDKIEEWLVGRVSELKKFVQ